MHSGRLFIADAGCRDPPPPAPVDESLEGSELDFPGIRRSPMRWPRLGSNPAIFKPKNVSKLDYPAELAPAWFQDPEIWYPFTNHPDYYGSIPWMVREVAGIPSGSRCFVFSSKAINYELGSNIAVIELDVEVDKGGNLLILLWSGEEPLDFRLYQLRPEVTKETVIQKIKIGKFLRGICDGEPLSLDPLSIGQLATWAAGEEDGLMMYDPEAFACDS